MNYPLLQIEVTHIARIQMHDALDFYNSKQRNLGKKFLTEIDNTLNSILLSPHGFKVIYQNKHQATMAKFPFVIIYEIIESKIVVMSIFHTSKNPTKKIN